MRSDVSDNGKSSGRLSSRPAQVRVSTVSFKDALRIQSRPKVNPDINSDKIFHRNFFSANKTIKKNINQANIQKISRFNYEF